MNNIVKGGIFLFLFLSVISSVSAEIKLETKTNIETTSNTEFHIKLDKETIAKGYTVAAFEDKIKLSLVPGILSEATQVDILDLKEDLPMPWQVRRVSNIYQFEFVNKAAYDNHKPFYIQFSYNQESDNYKQVYFFDKNFNSWRPLPTRDFPREKFVRSLIHLPFARIAVFENDKVMTSGRASWYAHRGGDFCASPDFPKGSKLRVRAVNSDKFVDVIVNDWGPERDKFPDRAIDLDKIAFSKIAPLGAGIIDVEIEPLYIVPDNQGKVLGVSESGIKEEPEVKVKAAVVFNEQTGKVLYDKNATSTLPLASLTKLVAAKVFLDTRPDLTKVVTYDKQDEEYNYQYVDHPWEVARLKVDHGETMTTEDLFYSGLVGSANNAIESLVRVSPYSRDQFILKMNNEVKKWGASSTVFYEPTGLSPENMTTALDFALITREVMKHPIIQKVSSMPEYIFYTINTEEKHRIRNTNNLIKTLKYDIVGSKTGYLHEAGYCLMTRTRNQFGKSVIVVTLGAVDKNTSIYENEKLIKYGLKQI